MSFGPQSTLNLVLGGVGMLPKISRKTVWNNLDADRKRSIEKFDPPAPPHKDALADAVKNIENVLSSLNNNANTSAQDDDGKYYEALQKISTEDVDTILKVSKSKEENIVSIYRDCDCKDDEISPNVFIVVSLDRDVQGCDPIYISKVFRSCRSPFIHEVKSDIPIGLLAHGMWGRLLMDSKHRTPYTPNGIFFSIYHDIGEDKCPLDATWERKAHELRRDHLIGTAILPFNYLMHNGCRTWHELPVLDCRYAPIDDCIIRVKSNLRTAIPLSGGIHTGYPLTVGGMSCGEPTLPCVCGNDCGGQCHIQHQPIHVPRQKTTKKSCKKQVKHTHKVRFSR